MIFFTSDTHFCHEKIIAYTKRPFTSVDQMNQTIIKNWNSIVKKDDLVYHLGDFAFRYNMKILEDLRKQLNGHIILIAGNHDRSDYNKLENFEYITMTKSRGIKTYPICRITYGTQKIMLCHYAMRVWDQSHRGTWHLYGHSHGNLTDDPNSLSFDVGVDCHNFTPLSFDRVAEIMKTKTFKPIDHHGIRPNGYFGDDGTNSIIC